MGVTEKASRDKRLANELLKNERVIEHPTLGKVLLHRPTPEEEGWMEEHRNEQYFADLDNPSLKSKDELERIYISRGMWSPEMDAKINDLTIRMGEAMGLLDAIGFKSLDQLQKEYDETVGALLALFTGEEEGDDEAREAVRRFFVLDSKGDMKDRNRMLHQAPGTVTEDLIEVGEKLKSQIAVLRSLGEARTELDTLRGKQIKLFMGCIEKRADRAEEMGRLFYCATKEDGTRLWSSYDEVKRTPPGVLEPLLLEMQFFLYGVSDEFRETLGKYGFTQRLTDTNDSSDDSPDQPPSSTDGESADSESMSSSEAMA